MTDIALFSVLRELGITHDKAEKAVDGIASSKDMATKADMKDMATKADVIRLEGEIKSVKADMATKAYIKTEIDKLETRTTWKMVGIATVIIGIIKYL